MYIRENVKFYDFTISNQIVASTATQRLPLLLAVQVSLCPLPLVWPGLIHGLLVLMLKVSGTLALWLSVPALYLLLSVCLQVPVLLSGSTLVLDPWLPCSWLVRVIMMEQYVVGDKLGL